MVCEDDVRPTVDVLDVLEQRQSFPPDWDVVTFHSLFDWASPREIARVTAARTLVKYSRTPMGAQAYLITRRGACHLLDVAFPIRLPADELLFRQRPAGLTVYGIEPSPIAHVDFPSDLHRQPSPTRVPSRWATIPRAVVTVAGRVSHRLHRIRA
jgi:GR25 family glycosyltransferase involved in LPS biosynthesis